MGRHHAPRVASRPSLFGPCSKRALHSAAAASPLAASRLVELPQVAGVLEACAVVSLSSSESGSMIDPALLAFAFLVFASFTIQTVVGFGSTLLCVTIGSHLLPMRDVVALAVPLSFLQTSYVVARHRDGVRWRMLFQRILPLMLVGGAAGYLAVREDPGEWLRSAFAALVTLLAARELYRLVRTPHETGPLHPALSSGMMLIAGVIHGIYASGGPPLVYAVGRELPKRELRSTLSVVWLVLDGALALGFLFDGRYHEGTTRALPWVLFAMPLGLMVGEVLHHRVDEQRFRTALFVLLLLAGLILFIR